MASPPPHFGRRRFLTGTAGLLTVACGRLDAAPHLIRRVERPPQLETTLADLDPHFTSNSAFFVRSHFSPPPPDLLVPRLDVTGAVARPLSLELSKLKELDIVELPAVLQCSGNGRALHPQRAPGVQWERGAVGNARWRGVRLATLLERAGLQKASHFVHLIGADSPPHPGTPAFLRSISVDRAMDRHSLVAFQMNGEDLPYLHGGPLRLVVPGWAGNHWVKWLRELRVSEKPATGFFMDTAYQMPVAPGSDQHAPLTTLPVKSWITHPLGAAVTIRQPVKIRGHAFSGRGAVTRVELSTDGGRTFHEARVEPQSSPGTWQDFQFSWTPLSAGIHQLVARATDASGDVQPEVTPGNRSGYLWNGYDPVACVVKS